MPQYNTPAKRYAAIMATIGWITLIIQLYLSIINRTVNAPQAILQFFSYFTVLTNIMVAVSYSAVAWSSSSGKLSSLAKPAALTAVTVYIVMVGIIYNTILRNLVELQGLQLIVDRILHSIIPVSFLVFWILFVIKTSLEWKHAYLWLWYPAAYIIYVIVLGELTSFYPYPFANVDKLGYPKAITNGIWITAAFGIVSLLFIAVGKASNKKK